MYETDLIALEKKFKIHDFPLNVCIEPTNYCNLNCVMCSRDKMKRKKGIMDIRLYKKIVDEIAEVNPHTRLYHDFYGEALTTKFKLFYMLNYAKKKGLTNISINTNGTLLDEEMAEMLLDSGVDYVSFDCDGYSKEVYEKIRIGGNRDKFFKNVEYFLERAKKYKLDKIAPPVIDVKIIEMPENQHEVQQVMDYWKSKGAWTARRRMISWGGSNNHSGLQNKDFRIACGMAVGSCGIYWDGRVPLCVCDTDENIILGDLNKDSLKDIWQRRNENFVKYHFSHEWDKLPQMCQNCQDWQIIGEERFDEHGNPINKNYKDKSNLWEDKN